MIEISDDEARSRLHELLRDVGSRLRMLGPQPIAVACATDKFNDAHKDDFWCAVRVGRYLWEQSQFFAAPEGGLEGYAQEKARVPVEEGDQGTAILRTPSFAAARRMLDDLEKASWRALAEQAFGRARAGHVFALLHQLDQLWLHISHPLNAEGEFYAVLESGIVPVATVEDRMDDLIGKPNLLPVHEIKPAALRLLSVAAKRQFQPQLENVSAANELRELLVNAAAAIRRETSEVVIVTLRPANYKERRYTYAHTPFHHGSVFQVRDVRYTANRYRELQTRPMNENVRRVSLARYEIADFVKLDEIVRTLDNSNPRGLFEAAFGVDTFDSEELLFVTVRDELLLLHDTQLFVVQRKARLPFRRAAAAEAFPIRFVGYARTSKIGLQTPQPFHGFAIDDPEYVAAFDAEG